MNHPNIMKHHFFLAHSSSIDYLINIKHMFGINFDAQVQMICRVFRVDYPNKELVLYSIVKIFMELCSIII